MVPNRQRLRLSLGKQGTSLLLAFASLVILIPCAFAEDPPRENDSIVQQALQNLPRRNINERPVVTIYQFRSGLGAISAQAATDIFTTALVKSGQFRVVERQRLNEGVAREKQLQQSGWANGDAGQSQLRGARYIFEGALTEANVSEKSRGGGISIAGVQLSGGASQDSIAVDVRVLDAAAGDVLDVVSIKKSVKQGSLAVGGIGNLLGALGKATRLAPDAQAVSQDREGVDSAFRAAVDEAVLKLATQFGNQ